MLSGTVLSISDLWPSGEVDVFNLPSVE